MREGGFTLLEGLVALLVLALGLLGVAAMQLKAMQSAHVAYQRSVATLAAQDAVERLWAVTAERAGVCSSPTNIAPADWRSGNLVEDDPTTGPDETVAWPAWEDWSDIWGDYLPGLSGSPLSQSGCEFEIVIDWQEERLGLGNDASGSISTLNYLVRIPGEVPSP